MMDRFFDNYVMTPMQKIVFDHIRKPEDRDPYGVAEARAMLDAAYHWLDAAMATREWACGDAFTLADCAAAPVAVLRRLGPWHRHGLPAYAGVSRPLAGAPVLCPGRR